MLKHRYPIYIISIVLPLSAAIACDRLPLSLGDGIDALSDPTGGSGGPRAVGGATFGGTGGGSATGDDCDTTRRLCNESGEDPAICRENFASCQETPGRGGYAAGGAFGAPIGDRCEASYVACLESGQRGEICRDELTRCGGVSVGGAGGFSNAAGGAGPIGLAGSGAGGAVDATTGEPVDNICEATYTRCLESDEDVEVCRDDLVRCLDPGTPAGGATAVGGSGAY